VPEWTRPEWLWALALPLAVLVLARLRARAPALATGALELWSQVARERPDDARRVRGRVPPALWLVALALALGVLALAGPRAARAAAAPRWRVVVDRSPSMTLPAEGATRLERALLVAAPWIDARRRDGEPLDWYAGDLAPDAPPAPAPPRAPLVPVAEPDWARWDAPGTLWISDRDPGVARAHAGLAAGGGAAVPGPVGARGTTRIDWDGTQLVEVERALEPPRVCVDARAGPLPELLAELLDAWAATRGVRVDAPDPAQLARELAAAAFPRGAALWVRTSDRARERAVEAARDGWSARGRAGSAARSADAHGALETWLAGRALDDAAPEELALVSAAPGRIEIAWSALDAPAGDPAAFAVSWAELFDRALLPAPGVVSLAEREAAGAPRFAAPSPPRALPQPGGPRFDAWLALGCLVAMLAAWRIARR
jgi:hypothetical protein